MTTELIIAIVVIVVIVAMLAVRGGGPRVTTIERTTERKDGDGDA